MWAPPRHFTGKIAKISRIGNFLNRDPAVFFLGNNAALRHSVMSESLRPHGLSQPARLLCPWNSLGRNTGGGYHFLFQGIKHLGETHYFHLPLDSRDTGRWVSLNSGNALHEIPYTAFPSVRATQAEKWRHLETIGGSWGWKRSQDYKTKNKSRFSFLPSSDFDQPRLVQAPGGGDAGGGDGLVAQSCLTLLTSRTVAHRRLLCSWNSPGKNTGVGCHFPLQGIFPSQYLNLCLLHHSRILYQLSHQGNPWYLGQEEEHRSFCPTSSPWLWWFAQVETAAV